MTAAQAPRALSERAAAALAAGRARRAANLAQRQEQAESQPDSPPASQTSSAATPAVSASESQSQSPSIAASASKYASGGNRSSGGHETDELRILFDDAPVDPKPATPKRPTVRKAAPPAPKPAASS